jgi:hypothetical protein
LAYHSATLERIQERVEEGVGGFLDRDCLMAEEGTFLK